MPLMRRALVPEALPAVMPQVPAVPEFLPAAPAVPVLPSLVPADLPADGREALAAALAGPVPGTRVLGALAAHPLGRRFGSARALLVTVPAGLSLALLLPHARLGSLRQDQQAVLRACEACYRRLAPEQAALFRLLPVNKGPDLSTAATAAPGWMGRAGHSIRS